MNYSFFSYRIFRSLDLLRGKHSSFVLAYESSDVWDFI